MPFVVFKIQQAANAHGESAQHYCDRVSLQFKVCTFKTELLVSLLFY